MSTTSGARPKPLASVTSGAAILTGLGVGLLGAVLGLSPPGQALERTVARDRIFAARGERPAPTGVLVVSMDEREGDRRVVTRDDRRWSRHVYAALIDGLTALGASAVVLDVAFEDAGEEAADRALESALSRSDRAVLFQRLRRTAAGDVPVPSLPRFASAARARAVFPLPKSSNHVEYHWPFFRALEPTAVDGEYALRELPSLPVAALQITVLQRVGGDAFERFLQSVPGTAAGTTDAIAGFGPNGDLVQAISDLRRTAMAGQLSDDEVGTAIRERFGTDELAVSLVRALLSAYSEPGVLHLNLYGPTRTIATIEHGEVLASADGGDDTVRDLVHGSAVFVGHSGRSAVDQKDGFRTVYTRDDGVDLSGVEIAATAYANLVDGSVLRPSSPLLDVLIHVLLGLASAWLALRAGTISAVVLGVALAYGYFVVAVQAADAVYRLLPLGVPILVVLPLVLFSGLLYRHRVADRHNERYIDAMERMLPLPVVRRIVESNRYGRTTPENLYGTCMITDVANYASLSESLAAERLAMLSDEYFELLTERTRLAGGEPIDFEGDSLTAVWVAPEPTPESGELAAGAAVEIGRAVERFNRRHPDTPFATRIGLHTGWLAAAYIGGRQAYRYRMVGDIVNTASRLEGLNKRLDTSVLASRATIASADSLLVRPLGTFLLKGKGEPLEVVEVLSPRASATTRERALCERFEMAMNALANREPRTAERRLADLLRALGPDGPTRFYLGMLAGAGPPDTYLDERGIVRVEGK